MRTWTADTVAAPEAVWRLLARPGAWHVWAPHVRGAWGLGDPEVRVGASGAARLLGVVPVPARITVKQAGRSWTWRVGVATMAHRVEPHAGGSRVAIDLSAPGPVEPILAATYGPVIELTLRRLAHAAS